MDFDFSQPIHTTAPNNRISTHEYKGGFAFDKAPEGAYNFLRKYIGNMQDAMIKQTNSEPQ
jgi:hypothetical protein